LKEDEDGAPTLSLRAAIGKREEMDGKKLIPTKSLVWSYFGCKVTFILITKTHINC
jgi:hypothetical protein